MSRPSSTPKQNDYLFSIDNDRHIEISSSFESGNIALVKQVHELYVNAIVGSTFWRRCRTARAGRAERAGFIFGCDRCGASRCA